MSSIAVTGLHKSFDGHPVLRGVDLYVPQNAVTAILGGSGSGKSTLLRCIAGLLRPDAGQIQIAERIVSDAGVYVPPERRGVGLVPQEGSLFPHLNVAQNVGFGLRGRKRDARIAELLELIGLPGTQNMRPHELSGGMQQRIAVARALAPRPAVVLLDEPFSALDAGLRDAVRKDVFAAIRQDAATAILVTHDQEEAFSVADRVAVLIAGAIVQDAPPQEVYHHPANLAVAQFVGDTVVLPAQSLGKDLASTPLGELAVTPHPHQGNGVVAFRPEELSVEPIGPAIGSGRVTAISYHGHDSLIDIDIEGNPVSIRCLGSLTLTAGEAVTVYSNSPGTFFSSP